jgi:hypothetical protein
MRYTFSQICQLCSPSRDKRTSGMRKTDAYIRRGCECARQKYKALICSRIAGRSISGWVPSLKTGTVVRQPFCSQLEERLLLWLEYHPLVKSYARGDIDAQFATTYRLPIPQHAPFTIGYTFENHPHHYLPDVVGTLADDLLPRLRCKVLAGGWTSDRMVPWKSTRVVVPG